MHQKQNRALSLSFSKMWCPEVFEMTLCRSWKRWPFPTGTLACHSHTFCLTWGPSPSGDVYSGHLSLPPTAVQPLAGPELVQRLLYLHGRHTREEEKSHNKVSHKDQWLIRKHSTNKRVQDVRVCHSTLQNICLFNVQYVKGCNVTSGGVWSPIWTLNQTYCSWFLD